MKQDLTTVLEELVEKYLEAYEGELLWNKRQQSFEIYATIYAENTEHVPLTDVDEVDSTEDFVEFTDGICFYNEGKPVKAEDFLAILPYPGKAGLPLGVLEATLSYFADVLQEGQEALQSFLADENAETFNLTFDPAAYQKYLAEWEEDTTMIPYPKF